MRFYVDSSAYLSILLGESRGLGIERELSQGQILSSTLLLLEASRNLVHHCRTGTITPEELHAALDRLEEDAGQMALRDLTFDLCSGIEMPAVTTPKTLDLAHLRTAFWFHRREPVTRFVTLDGRQATAAREMGLPV